MDRKAEKLTRVIERWRGCERCGLHRDRKSVVFWRGNHRARLAVIGEAPGETEDRKGEPFVGEAGALFDRLCESVAGPEPWDVFVCNTVGCCPPKNRKPTRDEWAACKGRLHAMLAVVRPRAALLLGSTALASLTPHSKVTEWRGKRIEVRIPWKSGHFAIPAVATLHPGYMLRANDRKVERLVAHDIRTAWEMAQDGSWVEGD